MSSSAGLSAEQNPRLTPETLGSFRSLRPPGVLPHTAELLDAGTPANEFELAIDVQLLAVDATSYRAIRERCDADPSRMAETIREIVAQRGKLQNPWTGSGGVLMGRVTHVGERYDASPVREGEMVVPLASLIAIPLALRSVGPLRPDSPHVPVAGDAIVTGKMIVASVPEDLPPEVVIAALDVYPAASYARDLTGQGDHVLVLGCGHAGLMAIAAARDAISSSGLLSTVDIDDDALARARKVDPTVNAVRADVTDPVAVATRLAQAGLPPADVTLLCTTVAGAEGTALLATDERGTVVFFSTATSFAAAALGADSIGSRAQLLIPNGLTDDAGSHALALLRSNEPLLAAFQATS